ncbi:MAG: hypothetical protein ACXAD7_12960 [Candidatus Kariarchaeaceae archaeon]|jgi:hypothetical protein
MDELFSDDEQTRRNAARKITELPASNIDNFTAKVPEFLGYIEKTKDDFVALQIANAISTANTMNTYVKSNYADNILQTIDKLSADRTLSDDDMWGSTSLILLNTVSDLFRTDMSVLQKWLPLLFRLSAQPGSVKHSASAPITQAGMQSPKLLANYVDELFELIKGGFTQIITSVMNLYKFNPEAFERNFDYLIELYKTDIQWQSITLMVLGEIAKKNSKLFAPHVDIFSQGLNSPAQASQIAMLLNEVVKTNADAVTPLVPIMKQAVEFNDNLLYQIPNILGYIGQTSEEKAKEMLIHLDSFLNEANDNQKIMILSEFRNLGEMDKALLDPYIDKMKGYEEDPEENVRMQARMIVDYYEGVDVRTLAASVEDMNEQVMQAAKSTDELMAYIDENIEMLKDFIADIAKKLPIPKTFSTEGRVRKTIILHFVCDKEAERCLFPHDRSFTTESKDWNKWLKIAFSGIKIGKSVILPANIGDAGKAVRQAYEDYKTKEDKDYLAFISQPFLTSTEQDNLINQLREAKFFDVFQYDPQKAGWDCTMCNL